MGGLMKGHGGYSNGNRGRPYGMMLLLAFGAAIIGVMVLHRFRERRIFNLLIEEKDTELISLQLLLQKERDHVKEAKWKLDEMRAKIHTLRAQKRELDNRIFQIQSTVSSLREEQKTIESELEEKQKAIKMLRDKNTEMDNENLQAKALSETLRQKESEIEDLKHHLESPVKIWSVSTDDPSNASLNSHVKTRMTESDENNVDLGKESSAELNISTNHEVGENSTEDADRRESGNSNNVDDAKQGEERRENRGETAESREITGKQSEEQDNSKENNSEERIVEGEGRKSDKGGEKETAKTEVGNHDSEAQRPRDETNEGHTSDDKVTETTGYGALARTSNAQGAENQEHRTNLKGGMKLEKPENSQSGRHRRKGNRGNLRRAKGKRWMIIAKKEENLGNSENNGVAVMSDGRSIQSTLAEQLDNSDPQNNSSTQRNETGAEDPGLKISDKIQKGEASEHEDSKYVGQEAMNATSNMQTEERERTNGTSKNTQLAHISLKDAPTNMTLQIDDTKASLEGGQQDVHEVGQSEKEATGIQQLAQEIPGQKEDEVSEQTKTLDFDEEPNDLEVEDVQEQESETETSKETISNPEADVEEIKGKTDEQEF